ncbi:MAG: hypothetical protein DIZ80_12705 [endosymbiont of Galathealinum brachiosum]|uniref:SH3b domain-containing protein n=1 Tax=endosymbiont of Galathealinum brachiosum TaxID=2200906 RepID=A0A370DEX8_9GAMM|nr:MAG: hypothetical protein DIZ80_12705 [endosymbiont of Galathealinum brachiosum]
MYIKLTVMLIIQLFSVNVYSASEPLQQVKIADPYIEMHTGPGGGYPIFHVMEKGAFIEVINRRANWFKIRNQKKLVGWVHYDQFSRTLSANGDPIKFAEITHEEFTERDWEWGVMVGDFGSAPSLSAYGSYLFNPNFATEASITQSIGDISSSLLFKLSLVMQPFPEWKYSPYFLMGTGIIDVKPSSTTIQPVDQTNQFSNISFGIKTHLTQKIILRLEYSQYTVFSSTKDNDNNEDIDEWKAGFAVFF